MSNTFPTLYKLDNVGNVRQWKVWVEGGEYIVEHGIKGGAMQVTSTQSEAKNIGRKNETTAEEQAEKDARSEWDKKINRRGYTTNPSPNKKFSPMLAHVYDRHKKKIKWPAYIQPKLDGCVSGDTLVKTKEYGTLPIKNIVNNKLDCHVESFNTKTKKLEYKPVVNYFYNNNPDSTQWYEIELNTGEKLKLTGNHKVFLPDLGCWRRVDRLTGTENLMLNYNLEIEFLKSSQIISIKKLTINQDKYDLEVKDNHNYFANNILVHNCRLTVHKTGNTVICMSRTGKVFTTLPHIEDAVRKLDIDNVILDGELYTHALKDDFQKFISLVKRDNATEETTKVQYCIYDVVNDDPYKDRLQWIKDNIIKCKTIRTVLGKTISSASEVQHWHDEFVKSGYEGAIIRNFDGLYGVGKRSYDLQKVKSFDDGEFTIVDAEQNKGKQHLECTLIFETKDGKRFGAKPKGCEDVRQKYWKDFQAGKLTGRTGTVRYFGKSNDGIPRFPVMISLRDYE